MTPAQRYIVNEAKVIEKECLERGITAREWIDRHAEDYRQKFWNDSKQKVDLAKKDHRNKSRWATWLERVNNI